MRSLTTLFILTLSISTASDCSAYSKSNYDEYSNSFQNHGMYNQNPYNQSASNLNDEHSFMMQSDNRMNQMRESNQNMINQDRAMMIDGYDPNQYYNGIDPSDAPRPYHTYPNQEQIMRGEYPGNQAGQPQSYPLDNNDQNHSKFYYQPSQQNNPSVGGYGQVYSRSPNNFPSYTNSAEYTGGQQSPSTKGNRNTPSYQSKAQSFNNQNTSLNYPSYRNPSYRNQHTQYISDNSRDFTPSSSLNHGASHVSTNPDWDTADDLKMRQSIDNPTQPPEGNKIGQ